MSAPPLRLRALVVGLLLGLAITAVTPYSNAYLNGTPLGGGHFPLAPFFILAWLFVLSAAWSRLFRTKLLTGVEMLAAWALMVVVSGIAYTGLVRTFFFNITAPFYFANAANRWEETLQPHFPASWRPDDPAAIETLYNGLEQGRDMGFFEVMANIPWSIWLPTLLTWGIFILLCYFVMLCIANLFGRQWIVNERVNFPLLRLPQMMAEQFDDNALTKFLLNKYFLIGLSAVMLLHIINGLNFYYPSIPKIPTLILGGTYFPKHGLFSGFHKLKLYFYPAFIGFAFLTTRQISFSFWFFFLLGGLSFGLLPMVGVQAPAAALGVTFGPGLSRPEEAQVIGATAIFFCFLVWLARHHLTEILRQAFFLRPPAPSRQDAAEGDPAHDGDVEWFSGRLSMWGLIGGLAAIAAWCWWFGMPPLAAFATPIIFFMVMLVASRIVCQGGVPYFTLTAAPIDGLLALFGSKFFGGGGLVAAAALQKILFLDLRESLMPSLFHSAKVGEETRKPRRLFWALVIALLAAVIISFVSMLFLAHKYGVRDLSLNWASQTTLSMYENVQRLTESPSEGADWVVSFAAAGAVVMLALVLLYYRFVWWPIHPLGYLLAYSGAMEVLWLSFFIGWLANHLCLHYGGTALFKKVRTLFLGFILADFLMGGVYAIIGLITGASYQVLPV